MTEAVLFREASLAPRPLDEPRVEPLRLRRGVTRWGFPVLVAGLVSGATLSTVVQVDARAGGEATIVDTRTAVAVLPVAVSDELRVGQPVRLRTAESTVAGSISEVAPPVSSRDAARVLGRPPGRVADAGAVAVVMVRLEQAAAVGSASEHFEVRLYRRSIAQLILPRVRSALGGDA